MNIGIIGSGGREHAICEKISQSKLTNKIYELHDIIKSQKQKNWEEFIHPERIDN